MDSNLISIIGGIIILAIIVVAAYVVIKKKSGNKEAALAFLNDLGDELVKIVIATIKEIDPAKAQSLEEFETIVLNSIYDKGWDYVKEQLSIRLGDDSALKAFVDIIDKDYVIKFIDTLIENGGFTEQITMEYGAYQIANNGAEEKDKELADMYSNQNIYAESVDYDNLPKAEDHIPTEEEAAALNPPKDEEEEFDVTDDSMELISEDNNPEIITGTDKNGNTLYYEVQDGKKKRVTKEYALKYIN